MSLLICNCVIYVLNAIVVDPIALPGTRCEQDQSSQNGGEQDQSSQNATRTVMHLHAACDVIKPRTNSGNGVYGSLHRAE